VAGTLDKWKHWFDYHERRISVVSLVGGFIFDWLTMNRIDNIYDNLWIAFNIFVSGLIIILLNRQKDPQEGFWLPNLLQFSFGALLGSTFVFYLKSATLSATWPFVVLFLFAVIGNEFFQKRWSRLAFQISFLYFAIYTFMIFLIPLLLNRIGVWVFLLSGLASLLLLRVFMRLLGRLVRERFIEERTHIWSFIIVICAAVNWLYFANLIPPIPLSLKDAGIYHAVEIDTRGRYLTTGEVRGPEKYFTLFVPVYWQPGEPLYAYSSIYAPGTIQTDIVHDWQYENAEGEWVSATKIPLHIAAGRETGFRTFSTKYNFTPGKWRVDIETPRGQVIGRINFKVVSTDTPHPMVTEVKE
jgi:hypothetical protein